LDFALLIAGAIVAPKQRGRRTAAVSGEACRRL